MSVFLTPELKPLYTGTYFPPVPRHNMPSFRDVLAGIANTWQQQQDEALHVSNEVSDHLQKSLTFNTQADSGFTEAHLEAAAKNLLESFDWGYGGRGAASNFPQPMTIEFLLRRTLTLTPNLPPAKRGELKAAIHALKAIARGGGFSRCRALTTDVCVPISKLAECIAETKRDLDTSFLTAPRVGHVGDGNFHLLILVDPNRAEDHAEAEHLNKRLVQRALSMGGTITGEHGVGIGKQKYMNAEHGAGARTVMRAIKQAIDPENLMNPDKMLPSS